MKFIVILSLFVSAADASEFLAGVAVPEEYLYIEQLFSRAKLYNQENPVALSKLDNLDTEWMHLLAVRDETLPAWRHSVSEIISRLQNMVAL